FLLHEIFTIKEHTTGEIVFAVVLIFLNLQTFLLGNNDLLAFSMLLFCGRRIAFSEIAKITVMLQTIITILIVTFSGLGLIDNVSNIRADGTARVSLGFAYVTFLSYIFLNIVLLWVWLRNKNMRFSEYLLLGICNTAVFYYTDARNGCCLIYLVLIVSFIINRYSDRLVHKKVIDFLIQYDYIICATFFLSISLLFIFFSDASAMKEIDKIFSSRLTYTSYALQHFGLPFLGGTKEVLVNKGLYIDSSYMRIIYDHGLIVLLLLLFFLTILQKKLLANNEWLLLFLLGIIAVHSMFDAQLMSFQHNTFLFLLTSVIPWRNGKHYRLINFNHTRSSNA
ncbi:hypothetical protein, partial [Bifidobacterium moukalabense]